MGTDIIGMEKLVEKIKGDKYSLKILTELNRNPRGLLCHDLMIKLGFKGRGHFYKKLNDLESKPPLITRERVGRDANVAITSRGKMILSKVETESKGRLPEIIKRQYDFNVGSEGKCSATFYLPFGSVDARQYIANEMAPAIERLAESLLKKSVHVLERGEKLQAWILLDLETDEVNEDVLDFREDLFQKNREMEAVAETWKKEWEGLVRESKVASYLYGDAFFFEASLARKELEKKGINLSSFLKFIEAKWPTIPDDVKKCVEAGTFPPIYKLGFRFLINNEVVDLSDAIEVQLFLSNLEDPAIKEWIEKNRDKDGMDQWFEGIPWESLGFPANEDAETEFVGPRGLLSWKEPEPLLNPHFRFVFHMLKRIPIEIGTDRWFHEVKFWIRSIDECKERGLEELLRIEDVSDFMFMKTYEAIQHELDQAELPSDLKGTIEPYSFYEYREPIFFPRLGLLPYDPTLKMIFQQMLKEEPRENPLIDKFLNERFKEWEEQGRPERSWKTDNILRYLMKIGEEYSRLINKGLKPEDALRRAVDENLTIVVHF